MQGPYLHIAFVRESIPEDEKLPIKDFLRAITFEGDTETLSPQQIPSLTLFLGFTSGKYTGKATVGVEFTDPSGESFFPSVSLVVAGNFSLLLIIPSKPPPI